MKGRKEGRKDGRKERRKEKRKEGRKCVFNVQSTMTVISTRGKRGRRRR